MLLLNGRVVLDHEGQVLGLWKSHHNVLCYKGLKGTMDEVFFMMQAIYKELKAHDAGFIVGVSSPFIQK